MPSSLQETFLAYLPASEQAAWSTVPQLEDGLVALVRAGQAAWVGLELLPQDFVRHIAARCSPGQPPDPKFHHLNGPDSYLAAACLNGVPGALRAFEEHYLRHIPGMLVSMRLSREQMDEVQQQIRCQLLTAEPGARPKLAEYGGRGALRMWLRAASVRTALNMMNRSENRKRTEMPEALGLVPEARINGAGPRDPERVLLIERHRDEVRQSFLAALMSLPPQQRTLLKLHYLDGRTVEEIGQIYRVHKATISRRLEAARTGALNELRRQLQQRLKISNSEVRDLVLAVTSQLEVSLSQALQSSPDTMAH